MTTTIDGVIYLTENAGYVVLDEMPQSFTIETDITIAGPGTLFTIDTTDGDGYVEMWLYQIPGGGYKLAWHIGSPTTAEQFEVQYVNGHTTLAFSYESTGIARIYSNGSIMRTYTFNTTPTLTKLHFGDSSRPSAYTAFCYIDEFTVYDYAYTGETVDEKDLTADFSANVTSGGAPLAVQFTDESTSKSNKIVSWNWNFGDGNQSTYSCPSNTFASDGKYHVSLTVEDSIGTTDTETKQFYINVSGTITEINADFTSDVVKGEPPLTVYFEDCSQSPDQIMAWQWNFDYDANHTAVDSTLQNASHTYTEPGIYSVALKAIDNKFAYDTDVKRQYIWCQINENLPPVAAFTYIPPQPRWLAGVILNSTVAFFDQSTNMHAEQAPLSWLWDFGDGHTSNLELVYHTYTEVGTYTVSLTVTNAYGTDTETKTNCITIIIGDCAAPSPAFSSSTRYPNINDTVQFTDLTYNNPTSWSWNFGDGATSTLQHPTHAYNSAGEYDISLYVESPCGSNALTRYNYITASGEVTADFSSNVTATSGCTVEFYDQSTGDITDWLWNFGDQIYSDEQNPEHTYPVNNTYVNQYYSVSLTVTSGRNTDTETKSSYITIQPTVFDDGYQDPPIPGTLFLSPRAGDASLNVKVILENINKYRYLGFNYRILWGDGTDWEQLPVSHHYRFYGTYTVTLELFKDDSVLKTFYNVVSVYNSSITTREDDGYPEPPLTGHVFLTPRAGSSPLSVSVLTKYLIPYINNGFSYRVLWEDDDTWWDTSPVSHTYTEGVYHARLELYKGNTTYDRWENVVTASTYISDMTQFVSPIQGYNPLTVYILQDKLASLGGNYVKYEVNWGDSTSWEQSATSHEFQTLYWHTITLKFYYADGITTTFHNDVYVVDNRPNVDFEADFTYFSNYPATVSITNLSLYNPGTNWKWYTGNFESMYTFTEPDSTDRDPVITLPYLGTYDVAVYCDESHRYGNKHVNDAGWDQIDYSIVKYDYITVGGIRIDLWFNDVDGGYFEIDGGYLIGIGKDCYYVNEPDWYHYRINSDVPVTSISFKPGDGASIVIPVPAPSTPGQHEANYVYDAVIYYTYTKCAYNVTPKLIVTNSNGIISESTEITGPVFRSRKTSIAVKGRSDTTDDQYKGINLQSFDDTNPSRTGHSAKILNNTIIPWFYPYYEPKNNIYFHNCQGFNYDLSFDNTLSYAMILDPYQFYCTELPQLGIYFPRCFSVEIDFSIHERTPVSTGTLLSCGDASINIFGPIYNSQGVCEDPRVKISFNDSPPSVPYTEDTEFVLSPGIQYKVILVSKDLDYETRIKRSSIPGCSENSTLYYTEFIEIPRETTAYIISNGSIYILGRFSTEPDKIYLGKGENTLGAPYNTDISSIKTYNYDIVSTGTLLPVTRYKISDAVVYWQYVKEDFPAYDCNWFTDDYVFLNVLSGTPPLTVTVDQNKLSYSSYGQVYYIEWETDGEWEEFGKTHTYTSAGTYYVSVNIYKYLEVAGVGRLDLTKSLHTTVIVSDTYTQNCDFTMETSIDSGSTWQSDDYIGISIGDPYVIAEFTNTSTENSEDGTITYLWQFGDNTTSTEKNPTHHYIVGAGDFTVTLLMSMSSNSQKLSETKHHCLQIFYTNYDPKVSFDMYYDYDNTGTTWIKAIDYSYTISSSVVARIIRSYTTPTYVKFTNLTTNIDKVVSFVWNFGDGETSTEAEPTHMYLDYGIHTVSLTATLINGNTTTSSIVGFVNVIYNNDLEPEQIIDFKSYGLNAYDQWIEQTNFTTLPATVMLSVTQWATTTNSARGWDYGDGTTSKDTWRTTHVYDENGSYSVKLYNNDDSLAREKQGYITVAANIPAQTTTRYIGTGVYTTEETDLINIGLTGKINQSEFNTLVENGSLTFATESISTNLPFYNHTYTFTDVGLGEYQNYLIMAIDTTKSGTEIIENDLNIINSLSKSYVTYTDPVSGVAVPIKLLVTRYPVNSLSGNYEFDYTCTFNR
jgi:PKD repeat protein